jgi:branched-chain amino acid transport system permease protein
MGYFTNIGIFMGIYVILNISLNLTIGFTGMLNIGHVAFYGLGAYTSALLTLKLGMPFWFAFVMAGVVAGAFGLVLGYPGIKLRGDYLALATLGFAEIVRIVLKNWTSLTRGPLGLPGIPKPLGFSDQSMYLLLVIVVAIVTYIVVKRLTQSPFGRVLRAIREDETAALALGKNVIKYKIWALVIGSIFAGFAGSLFAHHITFIDPSSFVVQETILLLSMVVLGGLASVEGSVIGAMILVALPEPLRFLGLPSSIAAALRQILYGLILVVLMMYRTEGIMGHKTWRDVWRHVRSQKTE